MNEKKSIPLPPGITQVIGMDDMRTKSDRIGITPAKCFRDTGIVWTNNKVWPELDEATKCFILGHEAGHIVRNTKDEFAADDYAFNWCMKNGIGLSKTVLALTRVLSYPDDSPGQKLEQESRTKAMLVKSLKYDWEVNGNQKAKDELMKQAMSPLEYESHMVGLINYRNTKSVTQTPRAVSAPVVRPVAKPLPQSVVVARPTLNSAIQQSGATPSNPVTAQQLEKFLSRPTFGRPVVEGSAPVPWAKYENTERESPTGSQASMDAEKKKKILGMDESTFYISLGAFLLFVIVVVFLIAKKKKK